MTVRDLPAVNASLNALSAVLLLLGFILIKRGHKTAHRNCMVAALASSTVFLTCYLTYHFTVHAVTRFQGTGWSRPVYFTILISHTLLAVVLLPLVVVTVLRAIRGRFEKHKAVARWAWPIWMYVSVTGVVVYLMLYRFFPGG
ncbi:MAG: DUF420 domain-containing protein [Verrucomicrobia bacterium]|nr:DUF420 domain-containing protein [Verrucomicrobiota bacterium]